MSVLFLAVPVALLLSASFVWLCLRAIDQGQFDDLDTPQLRALFDDPPRQKLPEERSEGGESIESSQA